MTMGRPRAAHVKREFRNCKQHGRTEHAKRLTGPHGETVRYRCMSCENEISKQYHADVRAGVIAPKKQRPDKRRPICTGCNEELPLSGICGIC